MCALDKTGQNGTSAWGICLPDASLKGEKRREERLVLLEKRNEQNRECTALGLEEDKGRQGRALHLASQHAPKVIAARCIRHRSTVHFLPHFLARFRATLFTLQFSGCKVRADRNRLRQAVLFEFQFRQPASSKDIPSALRPLFCPKSRKMVRTSAFHSPDSPPKSTPRPSKSMNKAVKP